MNVKQAVLEFWFGELEEGQPVPRERRRRWFGAAPETDREIDRRFGSEVEKARSGVFEAWKSEPRGSLALILLLDQFPRNIYRGHRRAYACDDRALALCLEGLEKEQDRHLITIERAFFYLPLEHAEDPDLQRRSVDLFRHLLAQAPEALKPTCRSFLDYAERHRAIIDRFGRFPHRNAVLGRSSTTEETAFLRQPHSSF